MTLDPQEDLQAQICRLWEEAQRLPEEAVKRFLAEHDAVMPTLAEAVFTAMALAKGILPPTINIENQDPECSVDVVPNIAREMRVDAALSNSFGFGGTNAVLVFKRV